MYLLLLGRNLQEIDIPKAPYLMRHLGFELFHGFKKSSFDSRIWVVVVLERL